MMTRLRLAFGRFAFWLMQPALDERSSRSRVAIVDPADLAAIRSAMHLLGAAGRATIALIEKQRAHDLALGVVEHESVASTRLVVRTRVGTFPVQMTDDDARRLIEAMPSDEIRASAEPASRKAPDAA